MIVFDKGRRRALAMTVVTMIVFLHFYFLIGLDNVLGRVHIVGYHYQYWMLYPLLFAVPVAAVATIVRLGLPSRVSVVPWIPAVANTAGSRVLLILFIEVILPPRLPGEGVLGFRPMAHVASPRIPSTNISSSISASHPAKSSEDMPACTSVQTTASCAS